MFKHNMHKVLLVVLSCFMLLVLTVPANAAENETTAYPNGMLTSPPPAADQVGRYYSTTTSRLGSGGLASPQGSLNPGDVYLDSGITTIGKSPSGDIAMSGTTSAYTVVQKIGVRLTLQRYTGSYWTSVATTSDTVLSNSSYVSTSSTASATKGYYYRVVGTHWINQNGITEQGTYNGASWAYN